MCQPMVVMLIGRLLICVYQFYPKESALVGALNVLRGVDEHKCLCFSTTVFLLQPFHSIRMHTEGSL